MTQGLQPQHGEFFYLIFHEETGWWAEFRHDMGIHTDTLGSFFERGAQLPPERELPLSLVTSKGLTWKRSIVEDPALPGSAQREYGQDLATTETGQSILRQLSPSMKKGLIFLQQSLAPDPLGEDGLLNGIRLPIEVLVGLIAEDQATEEARWQLRIEPTQKGIYFHEQEILAFTARFHSVENADPLSDCRALDIAKGAVCGNHRRTE